MSEREIYSPQFYAAYSRSGSAMPIRVWTNLIGKNLASFKDPTDIYNDVALHIKMCNTMNAPDGTYEVRVNPADPQWYSHLCNDIGGMLRNRVDIVDIRNRCIRDFTHRELLRAGELDAVDTINKKPVRLAVGSAIKPPPHLATNKLVKLATWYDGIRDEICETVAQTLKDASIAEVEECMLPDGKADHAIRSAITKRTPQRIETFLDHHGGSMRARKANPQGVLARLSKSVIYSIRAGLRANAPLIKTFYSHQAAQKHGAKTLFRDHHDDSLPAWNNAYNMYYDIAEDAMYNPAVQRKLVCIVFRGHEATPTTISDHYNNNNDKEEEEENGEQNGEQEEEEEVEHPLHAYFTNVYWPLYEKMPGHASSHFNTQRTKDRYPGNRERMMRFKQMYSGNFMRPIFSKKSTTRKISSKLPPLPNLVPINSGIPSLVPINSKLPSLVPINSKTPSLVPINSEMPSLVPINSKTPSLVPLNVGLINLNDEIRESIEAALEEEDEEIDEELFGLPRYEDYK